MKERHQTEPWLLGLTSEVPTFLVCSLSFCYHLCSIHSCCHLFFPARPLTVYKHFVFFWSSKKKKKKSATQRNQTMGMLEKEEKKKDKCFQFLEKCNTSKNEDLLCYFQNSGIEQCCLVLFHLLCVNVSSEACMFYVDYIYFPFI